MRPLIVILFYSSTIRLMVTYMGWVEGKVRYGMVWYVVWGRKEGRGHRGVEEVQIWQLPCANVNPVGREH